MCRVDERVYVRADGHRSVFQEDFMCEKGKQLRRICPDAKVRRTEYPDPTSSPIASSPITPNGPLYHARPRRPSTSSRPSTKDGPVASLKPEIHIEFSSKKGKGKSYVPTVHITTGKTKRSSGGSSSAYESPGSEASHTVRTGYPDISPPPLSRGGLRPSSGQYRNMSSDESHSGSSHVAHTYHTSDGYDTPSLATGTTSTSSGVRPIIHNAPRHAPSPIDSTRGTAGSPSSLYRTAEVTPSALYNEDSDRTRSTSSYAPEITGREADRQQRREQKKRQQEALDRELAANLIREENVKQVRFENDRANHRAQERAQEQRRAEDRERLRQQAAREREREAQAAKEAAAKEAASRRSKPPTTAPKPARRNSVRMSSTEAAKQAQLVAAEEYQMQQERIKAEALEREERAAERAAQQPPTFPHNQPPTLQQLQQDRDYYNPRGTTRAPQPPAPLPQTPLIRRPSQSNQPRPDLARRPSTRETGAPQQPRPRGQPPVSYDRYNANPVRGGELPSARTERRPSSSHANNPFAPAVDPWDQRSVRDALPSARGPQVGHNFPPQMASQRMQQAVFDDPFSSSEEEGQGRYRRR